MKYEIISQSDFEIMNKYLSEHINDFVNVEGACKILCVSKSWLYKATASCSIPHYKIGTKLIFNINELLDFVESKRIKVVNHEFFEQRTI